LCSKHIDIENNNSGFLYYIKEALKIQEFNVYFVHKIYSKFLDFLMILLYSTELPNCCFLYLSSECHNQFVNNLLNVIPDLCTIFRISCPICEKSSECHTQFLILFLIHGTFSKNLTDEVKNPVHNILYIRCIRFLFYKSYFWNSRNHLLFKNLALCCSKKNVLSTRSFLV
jgi:hypothetical protein